VKCLFSILGALVFSNLFSQDSTYVESYRDEATVRIHTVQKYSRLYIKDLLYQQDYNYYPNELTNIGLALNYKWIGIALSFNSAPNSNAIKYGRTRKLDLSFNSYGRRFGFDVNLQLYGGYYLQNPIDFDPSWNSTVHPKKSGMTTVNLGSHVYYVLNNEKFSLRASFNQTEIQKKTAGSLIGGFYSFLYSMNSNSPLTGKVDAQIDVPASRFVRGGAFITGGMSLGYIQTFVYKEHFYLTLGGIPSLGLQVSYINIEEASDLASLRFASRIVLRIGLGYNSSKFFAGFAALSDNQRLYNRDQLRISNETGSIRFFVGTRF